MNSKRPVPPKSQKQEAIPPRVPQQTRALLSERAKKYDPNATKQDCIEDLRRVQKAFPDKFMSRNFYREHGKYSEKVWSGRFFGTMEEFRSEAGIQLSRSQRQLEKHIAKHAALDETRKFYRLEIEPWVGKYDKYSKYDPKSEMIKMVVASDFHDIEVDLFVLSVFIDTCRVEQPHVIVLNGDIFDMYEFSHFDRDPRKINMKARMDFVRERIFRLLRQACPNAQIDFIIGNHEHRLLRHMASRTENMPALMEWMNIGLSQILGLDEFKINLVSKGNTTAFQAKEIKAEMAKNHKMYFNCLTCNHTGDEDFGTSVISGHVHRPAMTTKVFLTIGPVNHVTTGCMCKLDADYINTKTNWQNSFAMAYIDPLASRSQISNFLFTEGFVNINGRFYYRDIESTEIRDSQASIDSIKEQEIRGFVYHDAETAIVAGLGKAKKAKAI